MFEDKLKDLSKILNVSDNMIKALFNEKNPPFIYFHSNDGIYFSYGISNDYIIPESNIIRKLYFDPLYYDKVKDKFEKYINKYIDKDKLKLNQEEFIELERFICELRDSEILGRFKFLDNKLRNVRIKTYY